MSRRQHAQQQGEGEHELREPHPSHPAGIIVEKAAQLRRGLQSMRATALQRTVEEDQRDQKGTTDVEAQGEALLVRPEQEGEQDA